MTGKVGYALACRNEWVRGICEKPRIKCSNCPNQAFVPVSEDIVRSHLLGREVANPAKAEPFVAGVYPLMMDETCWFLAADFDNYRKRLAQEIERRAAAQKQGFIRELLPVIDNLERALASDASTSVEQLRQGGVLGLDVEAGQLSPSLVERYLELKERALL